MRSGEKSVGERRSALLQKNVVASFFIKGWSAVVVLLMVPATLHCLGEYRNGVWLTISSLLLWIDNMDIGLGNGLRNKVAECMARGDERGVRVVVSSVLVLLTCIIVPVLVVLLLLTVFGNPYEMFNASPERVEHLERVLMLTVTLVCTSFIFKIVGNFYIGMQLPAVSNLLTVLGQTLALGGTYAVLWSGSHSLLHIAFVNTAAPLVVYGLAYPYTFCYRYPHLRPGLRFVDLKAAAAVVGMGVQFFVIQICSVVLFMSSNILISNFFSPEMVTPYQIAYRYFSVLLVVATVVCMPFWNATTDAYERGDIAWIRRATGRLRWMVVSIVVCMMVMVVLSDFVYGFWVGEDVKVDFRMSVMMAAYIFTQIYGMRYSSFINGIGKLRIQLCFTVGAAVVFIPLSWLVVHWTNDIVWFMGVMCLVNVPGLIVNRIQFYKLINGKASGLWIR